jgi:hypothetical protein
MAYRFALSRSLRLFRVNVLELDVASGYLQNVDLLHRSLQSKVYYSANNIYANLVVDIELAKPSLLVLRDPLLFIDKISSRLISLVRMAFFAPFSKLLR